MGYPELQWGPLGTLLVSRYIRFKVRHLLSTVRDPGWFQLCIHPCRCAVITWNTCTPYNSSMGNPNLQSEVSCGATFVRYMSSKMSSTHQHTPPPPVCAWGVKGRFHGSGCVSDTGSRDQYPQWSRDRMIVSGGII
jgi:hypothetical protein